MIRMNSLWCMAFAAENHSLPHPSRILIKKRLLFESRNKSRNHFMNCIYQPKSMKCDMIFDRRLNHSYSIDQSNKYRHFRCYSLKIRFNSIDGIDTCREIAFALDEMPMDLNDNEIEMMSKFGCYYYYHSPCM